MNFNAKWLSSQERKIMRVLEAEGHKTQRELRLMLPSGDSRTEAVQAASLSRSLRRLIARGLLERYGRGYACVESRLKYTRVESRLKSVPEGTFLNRTED